MTEYGLDAKVGNRCIATYRHLIDSLRLGAAAQSRQAKVGAGRHLSRSIRWCSRPFTK